jgi:DNA-binding transcriptional LysR family regulator
VLCLCTGRAFVTARGGGTSPGVAISLRESTSPTDLLGFIDSGEADMVLMPGSSIPDRFTATVVADEEVVLAAPTDHPIAHLPVVRLQDLEGAPLVHFAPENGLSVWLDRSLARAGVRAEPVMRTAVTSADLDPLAARFIGSLRSHGVRVPDGVRSQLAAE